MREHSTYVGLDVHKESIRVAAILPGSEQPVEWSLRNDGKAAGKLVRKLRKLWDGDVVCCYEAGPCGYGLQRELVKMGVRCLVVAPSLIPVKPGDRIKTDRRDARKLARLLRAGEIVEVSPPTPAEEAARDLCRAREDAKADLLACRHRLSKMLLRRSLRYEAGKKNWTQAHRRWLSGLRFEDAAAQAVFDDYVLAVEQLEQRVKGLEEKLAELSQAEPFAEAVAWLRCFRGIDTVTAMTVVAELHGFARFHCARDLMSYLGLVVSEHSSGGKRRRGGITKTGNVHVRRVLVEAAWHHRHKPAVGAKLKARRAGQPGWVIAIADRAQARLYRRYWHLLNSGKAPQVAVAAVARELVGFLWSVLYRHATDGPAHRTA